jgi:hypothetical protein
MISAAGFDTVGVAADGDPGTNAWHKALEAVYQDLPADVTLDRVIETLEARERLRTRTGWEVAVTDMIHWLKRLRGRLLRYQEKGEALEGRHWRIEPEEVARLAKIVPTLSKPGAHVQYQDGPALDLFQIDKVLECIDAEAAAVAWSKRSRLIYDDEEEDESSPPSLYGVARYLMPCRGRRSN